MAKCKYCRTDPAVEGHAMCAPCWDEWCVFWRRFNAGPSLVESTIDSYAAGLVSLGIGLAFSGAFILLIKSGVLPWPT